MSDDVRKAIAEVRKIADAIYEIADRQQDEKLRALARDIYLGLRKIQVRL